MRTVLLCTVGATVTACALLTGCADQRATNADRPASATGDRLPDPRLPDPRLPSVKPTSPEPDSGIASELPPAPTPGTGPTGCPGDARLLAVYAAHLSSVGVPGRPVFTVAERSACVDGWRSAVLRERPGGPPFVLVLGPNIGGSPLAVIADGTDRDKGSPCAVAARSDAPVPILRFCRDHDGM